MKLNQLSDKDGARRARRRVGRGPGSGKGRTAGRGNKGQKSRSGVALKGFEGGQMPIHRRLPKRGFTNIFRKRYAEVNLGRLQAAVDAKKLDPKKPVTAESLRQAGVIRRIRDGVRLLGKGEIKTGLTIDVAGASRSAVAAVEKAGGKVILPKVAPKEPSKKSRHMKKDKPPEKGKTDKSAKSGKASDQAEKPEQAKKKKKAEPEAKSEEKAEDKSEDKSADDSGDDSGSGDGA